MPPKVKITKEDIINKAIEIVKEEGEVGLNARNLASKLNSSTQPIFSNFKNMEDLKSAVVDAANKIYGKYVEEEIKSGKYPNYKSSGIAYIRFANEEKELFKILYMRDRSTEKIDDTKDLDPILNEIMKATGFDYDKALLFHLEIWAFVHGIAVMFATNYLNLDFDLVSDMMTHNYQGTLKVFKEGVKDGSNSN